jgi:putative membrane protein
VIELIVRILVNAAAVWAAVQVLAPFDLLAFEFGADWWKLLAVALVIALINTYIKPILKALSFPINMMTLGLISFVINAALLLVVALVSDRLGLGFTVGDFPPDITANTIIGALAGSAIISIVSTLASIVLSPRKLL